MFNIPPAGGRTITPLTPLPVITDAVHINGTSQPGFSGTPLIVIHGSTAGPGDGIAITENGSRVSGLSIVGFDGSGIALNSSLGNRIYGNYLGVMPDGVTAIPNDDGVSILDGSFNTVGGLTPQDRNVISGNSGSGIKILGSSSDNVVQGNYIGTNASGSSAVPNEGIQGGVFLTNALTSEIGGSVPGARNVISGNLQHAVTILGTDAYDNSVSGNYIGVDATGLVALPNGGIGVDVVAAVNTSIGGTTAGERNVISGNGTAIQIRTGAAATNVTGNYIGTDALGTGAIPNQWIGIDVNDGVLGGRISNNVIANTLGPGIIIQDTSRAGIFSNVFRSNGGLAIDLGNDGVTNNDLGDADEGPNRLQNYPVIEGASNAGGRITITGRLNSTPNALFTVQFFASGSCDASGHGEGGTLIGTAEMSTDPSGNGIFSGNFAGEQTAGTALTATATPAAGTDTSEFSACHYVGSSM
jgi:hypothetical protein